MSFVNIKSIEKRPSAYSRSINFQLYSKYILNNFDNFKNPFAK